MSDDRTNGDDLEIGEAKPEGPNMAPPNGALVIQYEPPYKLTFAQAEPPAPQIPMARLTNRLELTRLRLLREQEPNSGVTVLDVDDCDAPAEFVLEYYAAEKQFKERWWGNIPHHLMTNVLSLIHAQLVTAQCEQAFVNMMRQKAGEIYRASGPLPQGGLIH